MFVLALKKQAKSGTGVFKLAKCIKKLPTKPKPNIIFFSLNNNNK